MTSSDILVRVSDGVMYAVLNRPEKLNAVTFAMYEQIAALCDTVDDDPSVHCLVLQGSGKAFAAGTEISEFRNVTNSASGLEYERFVDRILSRLRDVRVPTIASIHGYAVGGGLGIALACDLRLCTADSMFGIPVARTLGNSAALPHVRGFVETMGPQATSHMLLTGRLLSSEEVLRSGFVLEVLADRDALETRVGEIADGLHRCSPTTIEVTKEELRRIRSGQALDDAGEDLIRLTYDSADFAEGVQAFLEKRKPVWRPRSARRMAAAPHSENGRDGTR